MHHDIKVHQGSCHLTERARERESERAREREREGEGEGELLGGLPGCVDVVFIVDARKKVGAGVFSS